VVIGDIKQHCSVGAGRVFVELQEAGIETFRLSKIVRQQSEEYRKVVRNLA
jgi:ATP-dependent exoDNAse (exonuclease V) alpha subunit